MQVQGDILFQVQNQFLDYFNYEEDKTYLSKNDFQINGNSYFQLYIPFDEKNNEFCSTDDIPPAFIQNTKESRDETQRKTKDCLLDNYRNTQIDFKKQYCKIGRKARIIQYSQNKQAKRAECLKGSRFETQNLGKHLQTQTVNFLKILLQSKRIEKQLSIPIEKFYKGNGSISSFIQLFKIQSIQIACFKFYSSSDFVTKILSCVKMDHRNKIMMMKYLQRMRSISFRQFKKWKY